MYIEPVQDWEMKVEKCYFEECVVESPRGRMKCGVCCTVRAVG